MQFIISPTKTMQVKKQEMHAESKPRFSVEAQRLRDQLKSLSMLELKKLWQCSDQLVSKNYQQLHTEQVKGVAIFTYQGLQFKNIDVETLTLAEQIYLQEHLYIISAMYGVLRPFDLISPYRLDFDNRIKIAGIDNLYQFWNVKLYNTINDENDSQLIVNLASHEYGQAIQKYANSKQNFVTVKFLININGKYLQCATISKQARGRMIRYIAQHQVNSIDELIKFNDMGFLYNANESTNTELVFLKV